MKSFVNFAEIKRRRLKLGATLDEAAKRAGLFNRSKWSRIESGESQDPHISTLVAVAKALECRISDILTDDANA